MNNTKRCQAPTCEESHDLVPPMIVGEVVNSEGKPTGIRTADALAMLDLAARIENSPELMKLSGPSKSWAVAINTFLDLFSEPRTVEELRVWQRFQWCFGREKQWASTWKANDTLNDILKALDVIKDLSVRWVNRSRLAFFERRRLRADIDVAERKLFTLWGEVVRNYERWPARESFERYSREVGG